MKITYRGDEFFSFGNGVRLTDAEIQEMIDDVVNSLLKSEAGDFKTTATGDTCVTGIRYEDEITIMVSRGYDEATLFLEDGKWIPVNYREENERAEYEEYSHDELIDEIMKYKREAEYNPRREV